MHCNVHGFSKSRNYFHEVHHGGYAFLNVLSEVLSMICIKIKKGVCSKQTKKIMKYTH